MNISGKTSLVGIVADPIAHVRTPQALNRAMAAAGTDAICVPLHVRSDQLGALLDGLRALRNLAGVVVTVPHKEAVLAHCSDLTPVARLVGAANVIRHDPEVGWVGGNFDGKGFVAGLRAQGHVCKDKEILLIGAGGAGKAIAHALACEQPRRLCIHNRSLPRAEELVAKLRLMVPGVPIDVASADLSAFEVVVNATSLGLSDSDPLPLAASALRSGMLVCDAVMRDGDTPFLALAASKGCSIHHGQHMLAGQIAELAEFLKLPVAQPGA